MKNLVLQVMVPKEVPSNKIGAFSYIKEMYDLSQIAMKRYANRVGADYHCITEMDNSYPHPAFLRFSVFEKFKEYDQILYVDADLFFHDLTPNIFELSQNHSKSAFMKVDSARPEISKSYQQFKKTSQTEIYYNSGLFLYKREFIDKFVDSNWREVMEMYKNSRFMDQDALNYLLRNNHQDICQVSYHWNGVMAINKPLFNVHYVGRAKSNWTIDKHNQIIRDKMKKLINMSEKEIPKLV